MVEDVLVIYHAVEEGILDQKIAWRESNADVLDEVKAVTGALGKLGIDYDVESISQINQLPEVLGRNNQRVVFNLVEEFPDNIIDACYVPAICCAHGKGCTGNDTAGLLLAQNKWQAKAVLKEAGVPCPQGEFFPIGQKVRLVDLMPGVYIVKPVFSDASEGIDTNSIVVIGTPSGELPSEALQKAIERIHTQLKQPAIVEEFVGQRELNASILQRDSKVEVLPVAEIDFTAFEADRPRIVDYAAKWLTDSFAYNNTPRVIPAQLSKRTVRLVQQYALRAWHAIGCQDYARIDFRMDENEQVFVLEVNPNPAISPEDGFIAALAESGITYEEFVEILINNAWLRQRKYTL